ncbi:hypothetical protein EDP1_926 [Pseudomonas putida S610]|nr:hypothetical protein EDP1_926 [Pseudomonas putida S610]
MGGCREEAHCKMRLLSTTAWQEIANRRHGKFSAGSYPMH